MNAPQFTISPRVRVQIFEQETLLLDLESGQYLRLNQTGQDVWRLLEQGMSVPEIHQALIHAYDVHATLLDQDIKILIDDLVARRLIVPVV
ncbi:MAG: PqqD family protein [Acidobacteria bacterium]|nr:PqqD family protein [Acidobacteriota bacterium]